MLGVCSRRGSLYLLIATLFAISVGGAQSAYGAATVVGGLGQLAAPFECIGADVSCSTSSVNLDGVTSLAVSPDDKHVYATAFGSSSVVTLQRDTLGRLTQSSCLSSSGTGCTSSAGAIVGAFGVAVSPDGKHVYVASRGSDAIAAFSRNQTTGALTQLDAPNDCVSEGGGGGTCVSDSSSKGLNGANAIAISPDGNYLYVASYESDAVAAFRRNQTSGALTQLDAPNDCISQGGTVCGTTNGVGLNGAYGIAISPDGSSLYIASDQSNAVAAFSRNPGTGVLTQLSAPNSCISEGGVTCPTTNGTGLTNAVGVTVSPDGENLYVAALGSDAVANFRRDESTGIVTQIGCVSQGGSVCDTTTAKGIDGATGIAIHPNGDQAYATGNVSDAIAAFSLANDSPDGSLTQFGSPNDCISRGGTACGQTGGEGLDGAGAIAVSNDGLNAYVGGFDRDTVASFSIAVKPTCQNVATTTSANTSVQVALSCSDQNGDSLTYGIVTGPTNGTLEGFDRSSGTVTYVPNAGFTGNDSFTFKSRDGGELNAEAATVSVSVSAGSGEGELRFPPTSRSSARPQSKITFKSKAKASRVFRSAKLKTLTGTASDDDGVAKVELAVVRLGKGVKAPTNVDLSSNRRGVNTKLSCLWLKSSGKFKRSKATKSSKRSKVAGCTPSKSNFLRAKGTAKWTFKLKRKLPAGRYVVFSRATDSAGSSEISLSRKAGNLAVLTIKR